MAREREKRATLEPLHEIAKALALITQISPAAWRHILLNGHYTFQSDGKLIDLDALVAGLELG